MIHELIHLGSLIYYELRRLECLADGLALTLVLIEGIIILLEP